MRLLRINSITNTYFNDALKIYKNSFPEFEQRTIESQIEVLNHDQYYCCVVLEDTLLIGILFYWKYEDYNYLEHFAISSNLRGQSYGSKILKEFCENNSNTILEIDPPTDDTSIKRLNFYSNLGFKLHDFEHIHPPYRKNYSGHKLNIMSFNKNLSLYEYTKFNNFLKTTVMKYTEQ